ncbi:MAG: hypothetical protein J6A15_08005 [Clostridia bacterium]|nr:hypothetical protein [Clostridia bacterium]
MYGSKRNLYGVRPKVFKVVFKNEETKLEGSLEINFIIDEITIDMGRALTEVEEIMILTQIFYDFCLQEVKLGILGEIFLNKNDFYLAKFIVKDKYKEDSTDEENTIPETLLGKLLKVKSEHYDQNKKSQRVLANVKMSIELIDKKRENGEKYIYLQDLDSLSLLEVKAYHQLLSYIMKVVEEDGEVIHPKRDIVPRRLIYKYSDEQVDIPNEIGTQWIETILD